MNNEQICEQLGIWANECSVNARMFNLRATRDKSERYAERADLLSLTIERLRETERLKATVKEVEKENNCLRGLLGNSSKDCPYCGLPAKEQGRCERGFPGCSRADDQQLGEYFVAGYEQTQALATIVALEAKVKELDVEKVSLVSAYSAVATSVTAFGDAVTNMLEQMIKGDWEDEHGHAVHRNVTVIALKEVVKTAIEERSKEVKDESRD